MSNGPTSVPGVGPDEQPFTEVPPTWEQPDFTQASDNYISDPDPGPPIEGVVQRGDEHTFRGGLILIGGRPAKVAALAVIALMVAVTVIFGIAAAWPAVAIMLIVLCSQLRPHGHGGGHRHGHTR